MIGLLVVLAFGGFAAWVGLLISVMGESDDAEFGGGILCIVGLTTIMITAVIMGGYPTGESLGILPPEGLYPAKIVFIGEEEGPYQDEMFLMLWLRERTSIFENPQPIKTYRVPKNRFLVPEQAMSSDELIEVVVFFSLEHKQRMLKIVPQAP